MSKKAESSELADRFAKALEIDGAPGYALEVGQMAGMLISCIELGRLKLQMLTGLQNEMPKMSCDAGTSELKELLTNVIIMSNRLGQREAELAMMLAPMAENGSSATVAVDRDAVSGWAKAIAEAYQRVTATASPHT